MAQAGVSTRGLRRLTFSLWTCALLFAAPGPNRVGAVPQASRPSLPEPPAQSGRPLTQLATVPLSQAQRLGGEPHFSLPGFRVKDFSPSDTVEVAALAGVEPVWLRAFGLKSAKAFSSPSAREALVMEFIDSAGAYGLVTQSAPPRAERSTWGQGGARWEGHLLFWKANYSFFLKGSDPAELDERAKRLAGQVDYEGPLPLVAELLPHTGLQSESVRFYVTDLLPDDGSLHDIRHLLNLDKSVQAATGLYEPGERRMVVLGYPTHALALEAFQRIESYVRDKNHNMYAKRAGVILALTEGIPREQALALLETVRYTPTVKWISGKEEVNRGGGVRTILKAVVGSLVLSFLFVIGTVLLGTAFGMYRFYLRARRPENYFDRPGRVGMIRLKLVDK